MECIIAFIENCRLNIKEATVVETKGIGINNQTAFINT